MKAIELTEKAVQFLSVSVKNYPEHGIIYLSTHVRNKQAIAKLEESEALRKILLQRNAFYKELGVLPKTLAIQERKKSKAMKTFNTHSKSKDLVYRVYCHKLDSRVDSTKQFTVSNFESRKAARLAAKQYAEKNRKAFNKIRDVYTRMMERSFDLVCAEEARLLKPLLVRLEAQRDTFWEVAFMEVLPQGLADSRAPA